MKSATLKDVAREALVSIASASRAINGLDNVAEEVRTRVLEAANKLKYVPHGGARSLATKRTNTIGVLLPDIYGEFFSEIIRGIDVAARARGLHILVTGSHGDKNEAIAMMRAMAGRVDGLLVMTPFIDSEGIADVLPPNIPVMSISGKIHKNGIAAISIDNFGGASRAVRHLIDIGCKKIAHICGPQSNFEAQERKRGYVNTLRDFGANDPIIFEGDFTEQSGQAAIENFLNEGAIPDGIFAANDMMAIGALCALRDRNIDVPNQVSIIGFDDIPITRFTAPPLSTMKVGVFDIGNRALNQLISLIENGDNPKSGAIIVLPDLVVRGTSTKQVDF
jgi:LacI family transcriptional regulator